MVVSSQERLAAIEDFGDLGKGFHLAERDMGIRGFGNIFGEQQSGDIGNVGIDLFFEMLFESLSKVFPCAIAYRIFQVLSWYADTSLIMPLNCTEINIQYSISIIQEITSCNTR